MTRNNGMIDREAPQHLQDVGAAVARALMSTIFIWSGYGKLIGAAGTKAYFSSLGLPLTDLVWAAAVAVELGGGLAVLLGFYTRFAALLLSVWCIATALIAHAQLSELNMALHFMKNMSMAGGLLLLSVFGPGAYAAERVGGRGRGRSNLQFGDR